MPRKMKRIDFDQLDSATAFDLLSALPKKLLYIKAKESGYNGPEDRLEVIAWLTSHRPPVIRSIAYSIEFHE